MNAYKHPVNGSWVISEVVGSPAYLLTRVYYGHTKREALALFREERREVLAQS
jgi:hypothetical protein